MKTYKISVICDNCLESVEFKIPFGVTKKSYFGKKENGRICENCGCTIKEIKLKPYSYY